MKLKIVLLLFMLSCTNLSFGQEQCNCELTLQNLIGKIETEYPGLKEKTKDSLLYRSLKKSLILEAKNTPDSLCLSILKQYTGFFKDSHIWILPAAKKETKNTETLIKETRNSEKESIKISFKAFQKRLTKTADPLEGIWKTEGYTIGLIKTGINEYTGFIIEANSKLWKPKDLKFKLKGKDHFEYLMADGSLQEGSYSSVEECILFFKEIGSVFIKQEPRPKLSAAELIEKVDALEGFYVRKLTAKTTLIRPSIFSYGYVERIGKMIEAQQDLLGKTENLIVDLRGNGGGTDDAYFKLLPFLVTSPVRSMGVEYLATQTLIDGLETYKLGLKDIEENKTQIERINRNQKLFKANLGKFVNPEGKAVSIDTIKIAQNSPKQIVILSNEQVGSAAENLLLTAGQSKKVKILGRPSFGVLDYASARFFKFGCPNYQLLLPTYRSLRLPDYPIDNIGVQPDVYLDASVTDWLDYAIKYLEDF